MYDIIFDSNEAWQHETLVGDLKGAGFNVAIQPLPAGDIYFHGEKRSILIERKTSKDFAGSIKNNRLWDQLKKLKMKKAQIPDLHLILLIEGSWYQVMKFTQWNRASIIGIVDAIRDPDGWGIEVLGPWPSILWTKLWIMRIAKKSHEIDEKRLYAVRKSVPDTMTPDEKRRYIIEGLPNIGPKASDALLTEFGSVQNLFNHIDEIDKVPRIGKKTRDVATTIVTGKYKQTNK